MKEILRHYVMTVFYAFSTSNLNVGIFVNNRRQQTPKKVKEAQQYDNLKRGKRRVRKWPSGLYFNQSRSSTALKETLLINKNTKFLLKTHYS